MNKKKKKENSDGHKLQNNINIHFKLFILFKKKNSSENENFVKKS